MNRFFHRSLPTPFTKITGKVWQHWQAISHLELLIFVEAFVTHLPRPSLESQELLI